MEAKKYDYVIVGAGLYGASFAYLAMKKGKTCLVIEKRGQIGGNIYTKEENGINVHKYGAHIFHTSDKEVWDFVNSFSLFNRFTNSPKANYKGKLYSLPFNMNTFYELWGEKDPNKVRQIIDAQIKKENIVEPKNLEEQALTLVGRDVYTILVEGYTEKQWGRKCSELPAFIIKRLPLRFTFNDNYFNDMYQGIPIGGYTRIIKKMLEGADVMLNTDFILDKDKYSAMGKKVVYTGCLDALFNYEFGALEYRSLRFEEETLQMENYQGNAVINYTEYEVPFTRIIEHKHFEGAKSDVTVITREYPKNWEKGDEPYYPLNDEKNNALYQRYALEAKEKYPDMLLGGRLGLYKYFNMDQVIRRVLDLSITEFK